jgi:CheY-like chemotaxis protein
MNYIFPINSSPLQVIFADDDEDDHFFFEKALDEISIATDLTCFINGEDLIQFLSKNILHLPDIIFLDLNMPRKNGLDCLIEIKQNKKLQHIPVIIYSTAYHKDILDCLYESGAFHCIRKSSDGKQTKKTITAVLESILKKQNQHPSREEFALGFVEY